jgi:hypothetical protein
MSFLDFLLWEQQGEESPFESFLKKEKKSVFPSFEDFLDQDKKYSFEQFLDMETPKVQEVKKPVAPDSGDWTSKIPGSYSFFGVPYPQDEETNRQNARMLGVAAQGLAKSATLGLAPELIKPENAPEALVQGGTEFGGFMVTPFPLAKFLTGPIIKAMGKAGAKYLPKLIPALSRPVEKLGAEQIGRWAAQPLVLSAAEAISDVTKPEEAPERALSGLITGGIFNIAGLSHVTKIPVINQMLSQFGGRALMALAGRYKDVDFSNEDWWKQQGASFAFSEVMNSWFLRHGISPKKLLCGDLTPAQVKEIGEKTKAIEQANQESEVAGAPLHLDTPSEHAAKAIEQIAAGEKPDAVPAGPTPSAQVRQPQPYLMADFKLRALERAAEIPVTHQETGGSTFNLWRGNLVGRDTWAVGIYPERAVKVSGASITQGQIHEFMMDNADLLRDPRLSVGTYYDAKNNVSDLDIVVTIPDVGLAEALGKRYNQKSIFNLKSFDEIPTGGTGEPKPGMPPEERRLDFLQPNEGQTIPFYHFSHTLPEGQVEISPQYMGRGQMGEESGQFEHQQDSTEGKLKDGYLPKSDFYEGGSTMWEPHRWGSARLYRTDVNPNDLLMVPPEGVGMPTDLAAAEAGKKGWYNAERRQARLIVPVQAEQVDRGFAVPGQPLGERAKGVAMPSVAAAEPPAPEKPKAQATEKINKWQVQVNDLKAQYDASRDPNERARLEALIDDLKTRQGHYKDQAKNEQDELAAADPEAIAQASKFMKSITTFVFNTKNGTVAPLIGMHEGKLPGKNIIKFRRDPDTGEISILDEGKAVAALPVEVRDKHMREAERKLKQWDRSPAGKIDIQTVDKFQVELLESDIPVDLAKTFLELFGVTPRKPTIMQWAKAMDAFEVIKGTAPKDRMDKLLELAGLKEEDYVFQTAALARYAAELTDRGKYSHLRLLKKAKRESREGTPGGAMVRMLLINDWQRFHDWRLVAQHFQEHSRIVLWDKFKPIVEGKNIVDSSINSLMAPLTKFGYIDAKDSKAVGIYYDKRYTMALKGEEGPSNEFFGLTERQQKVVLELDTIFQKMEPLVKKYRFFQWYQRVFIGGDTKARIFREQAKLDPKLRELAQIYEDGGLTALQASLAVEQFGTIYSGNYLPRTILGGRFDILERGELQRAMDALGESHEQQRAKQVSNVISEYYDHMMAKMNIPQRVQTYLRQVLNLEYLQKPLQGLQDLMEPFALEMGQATPSHGRLSTTDLMEMWTMRLKGYPLNSDAFNHFVKGVIRTFFRAYVVMPFKSIRNLLQDPVTAPHKKILLNEVDQGEVFGAYNKLPESVRKWADTQVMQFDPIQQDFLMLEQFARWQEHKILKHYIGTAEKAGKQYPWSDRVSRQWSFTAMWKHATRSINEYRDAIALPNTPPEAKDKAWRTFYRQVGLEMLRPLEQIDVMKLIDQQKYDEAALYLGKWESDNTNFMYRRTDKSPEEQIPALEAITNLITFSKGVAQGMERSILQMWRGATDVRGHLKTPLQWDNRTVFSAGAFIVSTWLAAQIAEEFLRKASNAEERTYKDYGITDMLGWEIGGIGFDMVMEGSKAIVGVMLNESSAPSPEKKAQARETLVKFFDNQICRQMIPFYSQAMGVLEAACGYSYLEPVSNLLNEITKGKFGQYPGVVDRTILEGLIHGLFLRDPNKSPEVLRNCIIQREEYQMKALNATTPHMKLYYQQMHDRYARIVEKLKRYQPYKTFERTMKEEEWGMESFDPEKEMLNEMAQEEIQMNKESRY